MKILILGGKGQLAGEIKRQLKNRKSVLGDIPAELVGCEIISLDLPEFDISDKLKVMQTITTHMPDIVINCAAYTNVDDCETNKDTAFAANALGPRNLAQACEEIGAKLVHLSTDYVFDGCGNSPFSEAHTTNPQSVYGETKRLGEEYISDFCKQWFIIRTSWLYGIDGNNFLKTILHLAKERDTLSVVNDQLGNPTNAEDLAHHVLQIAVGNEFGIYHCTGKGTCSWFDFASEIVRLSGYATKVNPCSTEEFPRPAKRPAFSALDHNMLRCTVGDNMRPWQQAIEDFMQNNIKNLT